MKTVYSDNDLLLFLYDEMPYDEANGLVAALSQDDELFARYEYFQRTSGAIQSLEFNPSSSVVNVIMDEVKRESSTQLRSTTNKSKGGSWRTALLTGVCVLAFGVTALIGNSLKNNATHTSPSAVSAVSVANDGLWDDDSFTNQIENLESRTKALQDPIL